jgi:hypothetical protein
MMRSLEHLNILYVGERVHGGLLRDAAQVRGWYVHLPSETLEALAMYIFYYPDLVVLDAFSAVNLAAGVGVHLCSIQANSLLLVTDNTQQDQWHDRAIAARRAVPSTASGSEVVAAVMELVESHVMASAP